MLRSLVRPRLAGLLGLLVLGLTQAARAQTPEGAVITNTATVTFTDANSNSYASVSASVSVTVGFSAGVSYTGSATAAPASPSSTNLLGFTYTNLGNGNDAFQATEAISVPGVITVTGYKLGSTNYATLALLNAALNATTVAAGGSLTVTVLYDVASNKGGIATAYTMTAASKRDNTKSQAATTTITPPQTAGVTVTPKGGQNLQQLPSNGGTYTFNFQLVNSGNGLDSFTLLASHPGSAVSIVSVNGTAGSSATLSNVASGPAQISIPVVYQLLNVAAGTKDSVVIKATSITNGTVSDSGKADLTVTRPALTMTKVAYRDDQTTAIGAGLVLPNEFIQYKVTITNGGAAAATTVQITDPLPAQLTFASATGDIGADWTIGNSGNDVTATLSPALAAGASRFIWVRAQVK